MPFRATFDCLWCGTPWTTRGPDDLEGYAQLCPDCVGRAGENGFLRFRLQAALDERGRASRRRERRGIAERRDRDRAAGRRRPSPPPMRSADGDGRLLRGPRRRVRRLVSPPRPLRPRAGPRPGLERRARHGDPVARRPAAGRARSSSWRPGTGWWSPLLASKGELSVYDAAEAPLDRARERLVAHGLRAHIHVRDAWAEPDRAVDGVFCGFWLSHVPRARLATFLGLVRRWLKPGGLVRLHRLAAPTPARARSTSRRSAEADGRPGSSGAGWPTAASSGSSRSSTSPASWRPAAGRRLRDRRGDGHAASSCSGGRRHSALARVRLASTPPYTRAMSPLSERTIATVGSGVMAEAMIAGLLRGELVDAGRVVASHPRAERRDELARAYGIRTVAGNAEAVAEADVVLLAIKPQMLARVGAELRPHLRDEQLVLSVIAGATTTALEGFLGHRRIVRSMPNTPARLGRGMTVWYATPETTAEQRAQASALLRALGAELEVDDERFVAMATAVSGHRPDLRLPGHGGADRRGRPPRLPAPRRPRPRRRDARGQHVLREAVGRPSGRAAEHGHLARRDERRRPPRARVGPPADRPVGGRLGRLPADGRARRPARGERRDGSAGA